MLGVGSALDNISEWTTEFCSPAFVYLTADVKQYGLWALEKGGKELQRSFWWELCYKGFWQLMVCFLQLLQNFVHSSFCVICKALS